MQYLDLAEVCEATDAVDAHLESDTAVLLKVDESSNVQASTDGPTITELVLYASASPIASSQRTGILTPPRSSSPTPSTQQRSLSPSSPQTFEVKIFALPISSHLAFNPSHHQAPPLSPVSDNYNEPIEAYFFPPPDFSNYRKRQRLDSLFDGATKQVKRQKRHGGETTAKIMAGTDLRPPSRTAATSAQDEKAQQQPQMQVRKVPKPPIRSQTADSVQSLQERQRRLHGRHHSASGPIARTKNSTLQRVASTGDMDDIRSAGSNSPAPELLDSVSNAQSLDPSSLHARNKNALSRVIMAGMRMHGLAQRKKSIPLLTDSGGQGLSSSRPATASGIIKTTQGGEEDEYKIVYHQTFKAAAFALRREMDSLLVDQERMRDMVDMLLGLFCDGDGGVDSTPLEKGYEGHEATALYGCSTEHEIK